MKLKTVKKDEERPSWICSVNTCKHEEDLTGYMPGVAFPASRGQVWLCPNHVKMLDEEHEMETRKEPIQEEDKIVKADTAELEKEGKEAEEILVMVQAFQIIKQEDMDFANECLGEVKSKLKYLKKMREEATKPMSEALDKVRSWFKPAETFYKKAEDVWKQKMAAFAIVQAEAQRKALEQVQEAHTTGDVQQVAEAMTKAVSADVVLPSKVSVIKRWAFQVEDISKVPEEFLKVIPDNEKIQATINAADGNLQISGINIFRDDIVTRRGA